MIGVEHLSYSYLFSNAPALENVNINIEQGSFVVITGPNGAGKRRFSCLWREQFLITMVGQ